MMISGIFLYLTIASAAVPTPEEWLVQDAECKSPAGDTCGTPWFASSVHKVFPGDKPPGGQQQGPLVLSSAANSRVAFQVAVASSTTAFAAASVTCKSDLSTVWQSSWVNVTEPVAPARQAGPFPDPLPPAWHDSMFDLKPGQWGGDNTTVAFWIEVPTGSGASVDASVTLDFFAQPNKGPVVCSCNVPVSIEPWSFSLPSKRSQLTDSAFSARSIMELQPPPANNSDAPDSTVAAWYDNLQSHGVNTLVFMNVYPSVLARLKPPSATEAVIYSINTTRYDEILVPLIRKASLSQIRLPTPITSTERIGEDHILATDSWWTFPGPVGGKQFILRVFADTGVLNSTFVTYFRALYLPVVSHMRSLGLINRTFAPVIDEPLWTDNETKANTMAMLRLFKELDPELRTYQTRFPVDPFLPEVYPLVDQFCSHVEQVVVPGALDEMRRWQRQVNGTLTIYNNGVELIEAPAARLRSFPWMIWETGSQTAPWGDAGEAGLQGSLSWYSDDSYSGNDPWTRPESYRNVSGWGFLLYPTPRGINTTPPALPINSIRWQVFAQGLREADLFSALQRAGQAGCVASLDSKSALPAPLQRVQEATWNFTSAWSLDPESPNAYGNDGYSTNNTLYEQIVYETGEALEAAAQYSEHCRRVIELSTELKIV